ncbi:hypothetical protein [Burkholderia stagnalis]|uniref:hypothetical protein n=1 Tax=Burkholderia stagnalis TaxID=1503054 RepID=UPI000F564435|nr:hypothetical protein [Burkholderia stagnalis]
MTCQEIDLDIARTQGFIDHISEKSRFDGRDALAFVVDLGIGNKMEKSAALKSAMKRMNALEDLRTAKGCGTASAGAAP